MQFTRVMRGMGYWTALAISVTGLTGAALLSGCTRGGNTVVTDRVMSDLPPDEIVHWPFWPRTLRIHPLTRPILDEQGRLCAIEARVEFFDDWGQTTKACGQLRIDLHSAGAGLGAEPLALWTVDLRDTAVNFERFDVVTRTYLFLLELAPDLPLPEEPELRAYYRTGQGDSLAMGTIRVRMK